MISDQEIRGRLLTIFHALRHSGDGWVSVSDMLLNPDPVRPEVIGGVCRHLADVGLISWNPLGTGISFAMAKITGKGVAAVEARHSAEIDIRFPPEASVATSPSRGEPILQEESTTATANLEWIGAADASRLLKAAYGSEIMAREAICKRAHAGFIQTRAERYENGESIRLNFEVPKEFWWAEGHAALNQNWIAGDFDTWYRNNYHWKAFGVSFARSDIEKLAPASTRALSLVAQLPMSANSVPEPKPQPAKGGRPPADWWEDLLIDICFQYFRGDLKPKTQADILRAMLEWIAAHGYDAAESTVKIRARKVWQAIKREAEN